MHSLRNNHINCRTISQTIQQQRMRDFHMLISLNIYNTVLAIFTIITFWINPVSFMDAEIATWCSIKWHSHNIGRKSILVDLKYFTGWRFAYKIFTNRVSKWADDHMIVNMKNKSCVGRREMLNNQHKVQFPLLCL